MIRTFRMLLIAICFIATGSHAAERFHRQKNPVPNRYIVNVAVKDETLIRKLAATLPALHSGRLLHVYDYVLGGFAVEMTEAQAIRLSHHPQIAGVHEVPQVQLLTMEPAQSWGLDRIDERIRQLDGWYSYYYDGSPVTAFVIDSGVTVTGDLIGRVAERHDFTATNLDDCVGHGTQVASTIGGTTYGVAKAVRLISLKAVGCTVATNGSDGTLAALNWLVANRTGTNPTITGPVVANISLRYAADVNIDAAVRDAIQNDITVVVGAGNSNDDACNFSPSRTGNPNFIQNNPNGYSAITVAASDRDDQISWWSQGQSSSTGPCVDLFAPGGPGLTAQGRFGVDTAWSGTSAAAPHVAGIAALTLHKYGAVTPGMVENYILQNSTTDVITPHANGLTTMLAGTPNRLVFQVPPPKRRACCSVP